MCIPLLGTDFLPVEIQVHVPNNVNIRYEELYQAKEICL